MNDDQHLWDLIRQGDLAEARQLLIGQLRVLAPSAFTEAINLKFTNSIKKASQHLQKFLAAQEGGFPIRTVYTEMNGFSYNTDLWFHSWFAYSLPLGHEDLDLANWQSDTAPITLAGLEKIQATFGSEYLDEDEEVRDLTEALVTVTFFEFIISVLETFDELPFAVILNVHDYDWDLPVRRRKGRTFVGPDHWELDEFESIPTRFDQRHTAETIVAYKLIGDLSERRGQKFHRVTTDYQVDAGSRAARQCQNGCGEWSGKPWDKICAEQYLVTCQKVEGGEWADWIGGYGLMVSGRLRDFLLSQPGGKEAYQFLDPVYEKDIQIPEAGYQMINLLDHQMALDLDASEIDEKEEDELDRIIKLALLENVVEGKHTLFRLAEGPIKGGILLSRQLAQALREKGFTGMEFRPVQVGNHPLG